MITMHDLATAVPWQWVQQSVERLYSDPGFTVGYGTLLLINAGLAQGKNRSGLNWFLLSLFLGPVATFILVAFCDKLPPER